MVDEWSMLRLFSVQCGLEDKINCLKQDLLRYGYLIKANLPSDIDVYHVTYTGGGFDSFDMISTVLFIGKTDNFDGEVVLREVYNLTRTFIVVCEDSSTDFIIRVTLNPCENFESIIK